MAPEQFREGGSRDADARTDICQLDTDVRRLLRTERYVLRSNPPARAPRGRQRAEDRNTEADWLIFVGWVQ